MGLAPSRSFQTIPAHPGCTREQVCTRRPSYKGGFSTCCEHSFPPLRKGSACVCVCGLLCLGASSPSGADTGAGAVWRLCLCVGWQGLRGTVLVLENAVPWERRMAQGRTREVNALTALPVQLSGHFWMTSVIAVGTLRYPVVAWRRECRYSGSWLRRGVSVTEDPDPRLESAGGHVVGSRPPE